MVRKRSNFTFMYLLCIIFIYIFLKNIWNMDCFSCSSLKFKFCILQHALLSVALDQILHGPRLIHKRRHSVSVCQTPIRTPAQDAFSIPQRAAQKKISVDLDCEGNSPLSTLSSFDSPAVSICHFHLGPNADLRFLVFCTWFPR